MTPSAEQSAVYFENIVNEHSANPRMLIVHEVMGRNCGWLTAATAGAPDAPGNRKSGLPRPPRWQLSQVSPARAAWPLTVRWFREHLGE